MIGVTKIIMIIFTNIEKENQASSLYKTDDCTVNSEIFARVLFSRNFVKIISSRNAEITLSFTDIGKSCPSSDFSVANMYFYAIRENKIHKNISRSNSDGILEKLF